MKLEKLHEDYPNLFKRIFFECGSGWYELLNELAKKITDHCKDKGIEIHASQVKEKYGGLRFYVDSATDEIYDLIDQAEKKSFDICEICGELGTLRTDNKWCSVRCHDCKP